MKRSLLTWFIVLLLLAAAVFFLLYSQGNRHRNQVSQGKNPLITASQSSASHSASANALKAAAASAKTNRFAWRLHNTDKTIAQLQHDPHAILLENAFIDTSVKFNLNIPKNLQSKGDPGAYIVQARGPITPAFKAMLAANGATVVSYIPNNAYLVRATEAVASGLMANTLVQSVIAYEPYYKVASPLLAMADQPMPQDKQLNLALFPDIAQATMQQIQQLGGLIVAEQNSAAGYPVIRVQPPANWTAIAALPGVHIVEPYIHRHLANDLARPMLGISADSTTITNYFNLTGKNVMVEVNDSGIDANHPDFNGSGSDRVFFNNPFEGIDTDGHGTHVAGIIAGDGTESLTVTNASGSVMPPTNGQFRGKAPLANMFAMNFQDDDLTLQQTAATNGALISNNSWNFSGDFTYDLEAASYDAATRDSLPFATGSQPVLYVFSSGNDGSGGIPDTVDSPATAKDVMTVGALQELRSITNQVTNADLTVSQPWLSETIDSNAVPGFSSIGNVDVGTEGTFGRFKPDVVAPGTFVISCRSEQWNTANYYNPIVDEVSEFPDFIPPDSLSVAPFNFFVPSNAFSVIFETVTNIGSPPALPILPIYLSQNNSPYTFIGTNFVQMAPGSALNENWSVEVSNTISIPLSYTLIVHVLTTNNSGNYFLVLSNLNENLGTEPEWYRYETGTSMAAAAMSGFLALIQDYFTNQFYQPFTPSPALLKAVTINGARSSPEYDLQVQNSTGNFQGWGLPALGNSVPSGLTNTPFPGQIGTPGLPCATFFRDQNVSNALATGDSETFTVHLNTNDFGNFLPIRVTVAWTDPPGDPSAGLKLVNNLQVAVTDLDETNVVYYGNDIGSGQVFNTPESATNAPIIDNINNIENVYIQPFGTNASPDADYAITVSGYRVNVNAVSQHTNNDVQDYAIVISAGDAGDITDALTVTDGGIVSNPTADQNISIGLTNTILLNQIAGANTPLINTNTVSLNQNIFGVGTNNSQFEVGMTNQWHFYIVTNQTSFTNAAFITFGAATLSIPRMGVLANSDENATVPDPDLDMLVTRSSTDPSAGLLTNLSVDEISNCVAGLSGDGASLAAGGTDFVVYTNALPNEVFYVGVKSESHMAVEYGFVPIFSQNPFGNQDTNGNVTINGLNLPQPIPDGTPSHPGVTRIFMVNVNPIEIENVVVTNVILHQNFGNLVGSITHDNKSVVLNNHDSLSTPPPPGPYTLWYDDSGSGQNPGSRPSDGPGSLRDYSGGNGEGVWIETQEGTALAQTGEVLNVTTFIQKHQDLTGNGITAVVQPGTWFYDFVDVPDGITNLLLFGTNLNQSVTPPAGTALEMFLLDGSPPSFTDFDFEALLINGIPPGNVISDGPPLAAGTYWVGVFNPSAVPQTVFLLAVLNGPTLQNQPLLFSTTNAAPITIDAVTNTSVFVANTNVISSVNVGMVVQYPRISDLAFTLVSPSGNRILLMENRGGPSATNAGGVFLVTNSIGNVTASGTFQANTNFINVGANEGSLTVSYNMFQVPDQMTIYYGTNTATFNTNSGNPNLLFNSGLVSGASNVTVNFGPGTSTFVTIIMNQFGNPNSGTAWQYSINGTIPVFNYLTFTEDTNLTTVPIKFAAPPFDLRDEGTNFTLSDLDLATNGDYFGQTNIFDAFGGWTLPTNLVTEVVSNNIIITNANYNQVSVVSDPSVAFTGSNYLALGYGVIQRTNLVTPFRLVTFSYAYRGPGISGWWRGEGDARDSSDAETKGQNGTLIGRFNFPAGEVSQAFAMENNGGEFDFAGTNAYVQIRQQPTYSEESTNAGSDSTGVVTVQSSVLDVGTGPGFTVEGWINPTNLWHQQPLVEWLARVPTNGSDTNLSIIAGPFLNRQTDHYYYLLAPTNWTTSETWATQLGGHLATVRTANEENWIVDTFSDYQGRNRNLWIGLTNLDQGNYAYSSGLTNAPYTNWMFLQPTNCDGTRNYTLIFSPTNYLYTPTNSYPGLWALANNDGFVCEDPTVTNVIYGVVEVTNLQTNGVQFWISVTNAPGTTNLIMTNTGCLFANLVDITNGSHWIYSGPNLVQSNVFQHVALTYDTNSGIANLFYNGTNVASTNFGVVIIPKTTGDVLLGKDMSLETNNYYGGEMDEMSIYSRALSDAEIQAIYHVSAFTTNRLAGKFDAAITPPESLAEAQVVFGGLTNTILGANNLWQQGAFSLTTQSNTLPVQIMGIEPGILLDNFTVSEAPLGNLYYQPEQTLDDLKGEKANGTWTLEIWDTRNNVLVTNAAVLSWQLQMVLETNALPPVSIGAQQPTSVTIPPGQTVTLAIDAPTWAAVATNTLISSTLPLNVFFNQNTPPTGVTPPDALLFGPSTTGTATLFAFPTPPPPDFIPGRTYYIGLQNPGTSEATAVFEVAFNIVGLTNDVPFNDTLTNGAFNYYSFVVSTNNPFEATFQLLRLTGNADLVVSKGSPLPTLTDSDYGSFNSGRAEENIYVLTNSIPVPLTPGTWYLGVFNRDTKPVNYSVLAQELDIVPGQTTPQTNVTYVPLTNGVPFDFTAGPGAALTNFFTFFVTNTVTVSNGVPFTNVVGSIHFELYNMTGNGDLTVQSNAAPFAPPFFQSSQQPGLLPEFIQIQTNSVLTNLTATWYLGVPNKTTNLINYTILAVIDTNNVFPAFPGAEGAGAGAQGSSIRNGFGTNNFVYHVANLNDSGAGSLRDAVSSTNRTIVFDVSGIIYLQTPLVITNSYLTIAGQTAPEGGITVAGQTVQIQSAHDVILRYLRLRPDYPAPPQTLFASGSSGNIYEFTPGGVQSTFAALNGATGIAFDNASNIFVGNNGNGNIYKYPAGSSTPVIFATGLPGVTGLAFNKAGNLFVSEGALGSTIDEYTPAGVHSSFVTGLNAVEGLAFDSAGNLYASGSVGANTITKITPGGVQSTLPITGLNGPGMIAFDSSSNLYIANNFSSDIIKYTPAGVQTIFASGLGPNPYGLAFNSSGTLFEGDAGNSTINEFTPTGTRSTFVTGAGTGVMGWIAMQNQVLPPTNTVQPSADTALVLNNASNIISDHLSLTWSTNNDLTIVNSTNATVQWSVISDTLSGSGQAPNGALVRFGSGPVSLHHNLFADNYTGSPRLGDNIALDFVNNVIYNWVTNAGFATNDSAANPNGYTNYLNYICNYLIAGPNTVSTNIAFWSYTTNTWVFQTNNLIDGDKNRFLNGANTVWNMFTNSPHYTGVVVPTNQFLLPPVSVDETYLAYEKVLDFAGVGSFSRDVVDSNIVENTRLKKGSIINAPGILPTDSSTLIFVNSSQDGIPDFWKTTFGQIVTNKYNNFALDSSGYSELELFDNWLAGPNAVTATNTPVGVDLQKMFGKTGNLSFWLTNNIHGVVYLTNVLGAYTNQSQFSNSIAIFDPTNEAASGTNYSGYGSFDVYVTNNDTVANFGPITVSVFIGSVQPTYSQFMGILLPDPVTNGIGGNTIQWYQINVPTNAVAATNTLVFAGAPLNVWYSTNNPPFVLSPGAAELLTDVTNGVSILLTNSVPALVPGGTYYLGVQNTNNSPTTYAVGLDFDLVSVSPLNNGLPVTNTVPVNGVQYYSIAVPTNAIAATNILLFANGGTVSLWFNQTVLPASGGAGDFDLIPTFTGTTPGSALLTTNSAPPPPLVPGQTYFLEVTNTGAAPVNYAIEVNFRFSYTPPILPVITNLFAIAGTTFTVDDTATDTNIGTLFYSLTTAPPVGATIDNNGIITWDVPTNEPAGNILFTTIVTNSFTTLSATNSFTVTVIPEGSTGPQTNTVPATNINWIVVNVPTNAIWATNILLYATNLPVNVLFTTNFPPSPIGAHTLMFDVTNGTSILGLNTVPTNIVPGGTYYIGIQNTNAVPINYAFEVNFALVFVFGNPLSETLPATHVTGTSAQLNGFATPNGSPAYAWFEWGVSNHYVFNTPLLAISGGDTVLLVTNSLPTLNPNQVYHYRLDVSNALGVAHGEDQLFGVGGVAVWGENLGGVTNVPIGLSNEVAIAAEEENGVALNNQGQVTVWGDDTFGQTEVPAGLDHVTAIAAGNGFFAFALQDGLVTGWGDDSVGQLNVPAGLSNVVEIAAGGTHGMALQNNGTVVAWGANGYGQTTVPVGLSNVVGIAAGSVNSLALLNNGTVIAWGGGKTNSGTFPNYGQSIVPAGLSNVVGIASYGYTSMALKSDGTVVAWGYNLYGQATVPGGLNNVAIIANGLYHSLASLETGSAVGWGNNVFGEVTIPAGLTNIFGIAGGNYFSMALEAPLSINLNIIPITGNSPQTNILTIGANSVVYYSVSVPVNAIEATNLLSFATAPLNVWFNQTNLPVPANPPDILLFGGALGGASAVLTTNGVPPPALLPGQTYIVAVQNTNNLSAQYTFNVNFDLVPLPPPTNTISPISIVHTNIGGTNGFLLIWFAPTNDIFEVQETASLTPVNWQTFPDIITYTGPQTNGNGLFSFFDDGTQIPFGPMRVYRLILLSGSNSLTLPAISNQSAVTGTTFSITNKAISTGPGTLVYSLTTLPSVSATIDNNGVITWDVPTNEPATNILFTTIVTNSSTAQSATNSFTVTVALPSLITFSSVVQTTINGTNGFLLTWFAPTNDTFQVQESSSFIPPNWMTFSNIITYTGPPTNGNGLFTFFDNGVEYPFQSLRIYQLILLSQANPNTVPAGGIKWLTINVPTNAIGATNILSSATGPLNVWFTTNSAQTTNSNSSVLMFHMASGVSILGTNASPTNIVPGGTYYIGLANTGASAATYNFTVNFNLIQPPPATFSLDSVVFTTINGTNGFLLTWTAPTNDTFQVQESSSFIPPFWMTFSGIVTYTGPPTNGNGLFTYFDNGSQFPFGALRIYQLLLLSSGSSGSLVLPGLSSYMANISQPLAVTNKATDSNPSATQAYNVTTFPATVSSPSINNGTGIITWTPSPTEAGGAYKFTTVVTDNSPTPLHATNAFTIFVMPAPPLKSAVVTSANTTLTWTAKTNDLFQVQWTTNKLPAVVWSTFPQTVTSTTGSFSFTDTNAPGAMKLYRLVWLPLP